LAAAVGTPTVSVHGRGGAAQWKPPGERHVALQAPDCLPASVTPEEVAEAVRRVLEAEGPRSAALAADAEIEWKHA
jgi:ADP-heptose:LPS heptosyltransferase